MSNQAFPARTWGVVQYMNGCACALAGFVARARELAGKYGPQLVPAYWWGPRTSATGCAGNEEPGPKRPNRAGAEAEQ